MEQCSCDQTYSAIYNEFSWLYCVTGTENKVRCKEISIAEYVVIITLCSGILGLMSLVLLCLCDPAGYSGISGV